MIVIVVASAGLPEVRLRRKLPSNPLMEENPPTDSISTLPVNEKLTSASKFSERTDSGKLIPDWETTNELFSMTEYVSSTTSGGSLTETTSIPTFPGIEEPSPSKAT